MGTDDLVPITVREFCEGLTKKGGAGWLIVPLLLYAVLRDLGAIRGGLAAIVSAAGFIRSQCSCALAACEPDVALLALSRATWLVSGLSSLALLALVLASEAYEPLDAWLPIFRVHLQLGAVLLSYVVLRGGWRLSWKLERRAGDFQLKRLTAESIDYSARARAAEARSLLPAA